MEFGCGRLSTRLQSFCFYAPSGLVIPPFILGTWKRERYARRIEYLELAYEAIKGRPYFVEE